MYLKTATSDSTLLRICRSWVCVLFLSLLPVAVAGQMPQMESGDWWKLEVGSTGIYRVTTADVPGLQGAAVNGIAVWSMSGEQLPVCNSSAETMRQLATEVVDVNGNGLFDATDAVLFFAEGVDVWRWDSGDGRWEMRRHSYARANYCYLTTAETSPLRIQSASSVDAVLQEGYYRAVTAVNNDLANVFGTGQVWVGERFTSALPTRSVTLSLPATATDLRLRYALASRSSVAASFRLTSTGFDVTHTIAAKTVYGTWLEALPGSRSSVTFDIRYSPGENTAEGWLDYIELTGRMPISFTGQQLVVRTDGPLASATSFSGNGVANCRVWDVTTMGSERELTVSSGCWTDTAGPARQYILFGSQYLRPASVSKLTNQNLHSQADYVIVCNPLFLAQAQRLATIHEIVDGITALVVTDEQVYNQYSSGKQDPMAIRALLRDLRDRHPSAPPRWLLLFGKASYDPRDILGLNLPIVVTFETYESFKEEGDSYCSDDMMGYLEDHECGSSMQTVDVGIGRLPAKTIDEATRLVDKIENYIMRSDLAGDSDKQSGNQNGDWRNFVALLADDADPGRGGDTSFTRSSENTARSIASRYPAINVEKLYADAYRQQSGAIGSFYPDLNNALRQRIDYGCLLLNYVGHGSTKYIGTERYIEPSDIDGYNNEGRLPLLVASTCSYGWHDLPDDLCGSELFMLAEGGAIGVVSAARPISHDGPFDTDVILFALDPDNTIGDALRYARNNHTVKLSIGLLGDPALHLSLPQKNIVVTHIDGRPVTDGVDDTATVLSQVTISGEIRDHDGTLLTDFDGTVYPVVYDRATQATTLANDNPGTEVSFTQQKSILYKGSERVEGGRFQYTFTVPRDVQYQYDYGRLSHYAVSGTEDATGSYLRLLFGGLNENIQITETRPEIRLFLGDTNFLSGGLTDPNPTLVARLWDSVGINAFGSGLGHDITVTIDGYAGSTVVLNDFFQPDVDDPRGGTVRYTFSDLTPGTHLLTLKAWNIWGYSNTAQLLFRVRGADTAQFSSLKVHPNPATDYALFHYETNSAASIRSAVLQIYTSNGSRVQTFLPVAAEGSFVVGPIRWDISGVAPGIYLARILVTTTDGQLHSSSAKVVVR